MNAKAMLRQDLVRLKSHPCLADLLPILVLIIAAYSVGGAFIVLYDVLGIIPMQHGEVPTTELEFAKEAAQIKQAVLAQTATQTELAADLNTVYLQFKWHRFNEWFDNHPILRWIYTIPVIFAAIAPFAYFAMGLFSAKKPPERLRLSFQITVGIGGFIWFLSFFATGLIIQRMDQFIIAALFFGIYGALCLHLFTGVQSKLRVYIPRILFTSLIGLMIVSNLMSSGHVFDNAAPIYEQARIPLQNAMLTDSLKNINVWAQSGRIANLSMLVALLPMFIYSLFIAKMKIKHPVLHMILTASYTGFLVSLAALLIGVTIITPFITCYCMLLFMWSGMFLLNDWAQIEGQKQAVITNIDKLIAKLPKP